MTELLIVVGQTLAIYAFLVVALCRVGRSFMAGLTHLHYLIVALLGSTVETGLYHGSGSLLSGLVSAATLLSANWATCSVMSRWPRLRRLLVGVPIVLVHNGRILPAHLRMALLTEQDLMTAVRRRGYDDLELIRLAIMERNGEVAVVPKNPNGHRPP